MDAFVSKGETEIEDFKHKGHDGHKGFKAGSQIVFSLVDFVPFVVDMSPRI